MQGSAYELDGQAGSHETYLSRIKFRGRKLPIGVVPWLEPVPRGWP